MRVEHHIVMLYPTSGITIAITDKVTAERNPENVKLPYGSFGFFYYDKIQKEPYLTNRSCRYLQGNKMSIEDAIEHFAHTDNCKKVLENFQKRGVHTVIKTGSTTFVGYEQGDTLI